jgi:hypothetical protein
MLYYTSVPNLQMNEIEIGLNVFINNCLITNHWKKIAHE